MTRLALILLLLLACATAVLRGAQGDAELLEAQTSGDCIDADGLDEALAVGDATTELGAQRVSASAATGGVPQWLGEPGIDRPPCARS